MSDLSQQIRSGFGSIAQSRTREGVIDAYADFHELLEAEKPEPSVIVAAGRQEVRALQAIADMRTSTTYQRRGGQVGFGRVFRGSGIVAIGNSDGELLAVDYQTDSSGNDPVDAAYREFFGPYQRVGLRKAAQALLLHGLGLNEATFRAQYRQVQDVLSEKLGEAHRHYMGYNSGNGLAVGASGMLAEDSIISYARTMPWYEGYAEDAIRKSELETQDSLDVLAGWFDHKAAEATVANLGGQRGAGQFMFGNLFPPESLITQVNLS